MTINIKTDSPIITTGSQLDAITTETVKQSGEIKKTEDTRHEAQAIKSNEASLSRSQVPELIKPSQGINVALLSKSQGDLNGTLSILLLLLELARKAREMGLQQRDIENKATITAQKEQVAEMVSGAKLMIAMAVVSGIMAATSTVASAFSIAKEVKIVKQEQILNSNIAGREQLIDTKMQQMSNIGDKAVSREDIGRIWKPEQVADQNKLALLDKEFRMTDSKANAFNAATQPLGQMANSAIQVHQGYSQAEVKEKEVNASIAANEKQKAEEAMNYNDNFMKDVLRLIEQYVSSHTHAMKAAFGVV